MAREEDHRVDFRPELHWVAIRLDVLLALVAELEELRGSGESWLPELDRAWRGDEGEARS